MDRENKYKIIYIKNGEEKTCICSGDESKERNLETCKRNNYKVVSCRKLYPFSTIKNQHNFELIHNIAMCELYEIWRDEKKVSDEEYERLNNLKERTEYFFCLPLPVAWLPYEEWKEAKEISQSAIFHRQEACVKNGRPDLVTYC